MNSTATKISQHQWVYVAFATEGGCDLGVTSSFSGASATGVASQAWWVHGHGKG